MGELEHFLEKKGKDRMGNPVCRRRGSDHSVESAVLREQSQEQKIETRLLQSCDLLAPKKCLLCPLRLFKPFNKESLWRQLLN